MGGFSVITYKGREVRYLDYRGMKLEDIKEKLDETTKEALRLNKRRLVLANLTGVYAVPEFMDTVKEAGKKTKHLTIKSAIVGITGAKKILLNAYNMFTNSNTMAFDDEETAKEWLIKD